MEDDAVFQVDARGPGGSEYCRVRWQRKEINAAILTWTAPGNQVLSLLVVLRCPLCDYPISTRPDVGASCSVSAAGLTLRQVVQCPAHWPVVDEAGNIVTDPVSGRPKRESCFFKTVILDGQAHDPKCPRIHRDHPTSCTCRDA